MERFGDCYEICLADGQPAGYIGEIDGDLRLATHPDFQRRGVARFMLSDFVRRHPATYAKVKIDNIASLALFKALGFREEFIILRPPREQIFQ